jgi:hypothetical protein
MDDLVEGFLYEERLYTTNWYSSLVVSESSPDLWSFSYLTLTLQINKGRIKQSEQFINPGECWQC